MINKTSKLAFVSVLIVTSWLKNIPDSKSTFNPEQSKCFNVVFTPPILSKMLLGLAKFVHKHKVYCNNVSLPTVMVKCMSQTYCQTFANIFMLFGARY